MEPLVEQMGQEYMQKAVELALESVRQGGGPFAALIVGPSGIISHGVNGVTKLNDPTAHAEILAIRSACELLQRFELSGYDLYSTCEPCPMCLAAAYWSRLDRIFYGSTRAQAAAAGFDDEHIYEELSSDPSDRALQMIRIPVNDSGREFKVWRDFEGRTEY